jgi:hypothetical protein
MFGWEPIARLLLEQAGAPLSELRTHLLRQHQDYTGGIYEDDVAFLMLRATEATSA